MKEGTERENGVNAGDACVRFWFSSARDWFFLRWKTRSFFFSFWRKRLFYNPGKEKKKKKFLLVFEQAVFGWVSDEDREKKKTNSIMKNNFFFFRLNRVWFQIELSGFQPKIDILRPLKNVRTKNKKASAKLDFSNVLSFVRYDHQ